jgi:hypothetical protein
VECESKLIPVIIGATETISGSLRQYRSNIPGKHKIKELKKKKKKNTQGKTQKKKKKKKKKKKITKTK